MTLKKRKKNLWEFLIIFTICMVCLLVPNRISAAKSPKLNSRKITLPVSNSKDLKLLNYQKKANFRIISGKKVISLQNREKQSVTVVAKKAGKAKIQVKAGGQKYLCTVKVTKRTRNKDGRDQADVSALKKLIKAQRKRGAKCKTDLSSNEYKWNKKNGRLIEIDWDRCNVSGKLSLADFSALKVFQCYRNKLTSIDTSNNLNLTNISIANNRLKTLDVSNSRNLERLSCSNNPNLHQIDVTQNKKLIHLYCDNMGLKNLNIKYNTKLAYLTCDKNALKNIDLSKNTALRWLECKDCKLSSLSLPKAPNLNYLNCSDNPIKTLDISKTPNLSDLCFINTNILSMDLRTIQDKNCTIGCNDGVRLRWKDRDAAELAALNKIAAEQQARGATLSGNLSIINEEIYAAQKNWELEYMWSRDGKLERIIWDKKNLSQTISLAAFPSLESLSCRQNKLTGIDVSKNSKLYGLYCSDNQLSSLDVSKNSLLSALECGNNQLSTLDLSKSPALYRLECSDNQLSSLDVSKCPALTELYCYNNPLKSLDLSQNTKLWLLGITGNEELTTLDLSHNKDLTPANVYTTGSTIQLIW